LDYKYSLGFGHSRILGEGCPLFKVIDFVALFAKNFHIKNLRKNDAVKK